MSPYLVAVYVDDIIESIESKSIGCLFKSVIINIIFYTDDYWHPLLPRCKSLLICVKMI